MSIKPINTTQQQKLIDLVKDANSLIRSLSDGLGGCDHSVGICYCAIRNWLVECEMLVAELNPDLRPFEIHYAGCAEEEDKPQIKVIHAGDEEHAKRLFVNWFGGGCKIIKVVDINYEKTRDRLVAGAAEAIGQFGDDELERYAAELKEKENKQTGENNP